MNLLYAMAAKLTVENLYSVRKLEEQENWWKFSKVNCNGYLYEFMICNGYKADGCETVEN